MLGSKVDLDKESVPLCRATATPVSSVQAWPFLVFRVNSCFLPDLLCKGILHLAVVLLGSGPVKSKNVDVTITAKRDRFNMRRVLHSFVFNCLLQDCINNSTF